MSFFYYDKTYSYEGYGVKFEYPEPWENRKVENKNIKKSIYIRKNGTRIINLFVVKNNKDISENELKKSLENKGWIIQKTEYCFINNKKALRIYSKGKDRKTISSIDTYIIHNDLLYNFNFSITSNKIENVSEEYWELLDSIEFIKPEEKNLKILYSENVNPQEFNSEDFNKHINNNEEMNKEDLLFRYAELYEKGLLTKEEFENEKKKLLHTEENEEISEEKGNKSQQLKKKKEKGTFKKDFILIPIIIILIIAIIGVIILGQNHSPMNTEIYGISNDVFHTPGNAFYNESYAYGVIFEIKNMPLNPEDFTCFCEYYDSNNKLVYNGSMTLGNVIDPERIDFEDEFESQNLMNLSYVDLVIIDKNGKFVASNHYEWNNNPSLIREAPTC